MPLVIFPKDNKGPPCNAELRFKKPYASVSHLTLDSKGLFPILLVSHVAVLLLYIGMETPSVWKAKISFWKPLPGTEQGR